MTADRRAEPAALPAFCKNSAPEFGPVQPLKYSL